MCERPGTRQTTHLNGYLVIADVPDADDDAEWASDHLRTWHGWTEVEIEAASGQDWHNEEHWRREAHGVEVAIDVPHVHFFGVERAIETSDLDDAVKDALLAVLAVSGGS